MYVFVSVPVYMLTHVCTCVYVCGSCMCVSMCTVYVVHACAYICVHVHACVCGSCVYVPMCTCVCSHVYICSCVCVCSCVEHILLPLSILIFDTGFLTETGVQ